MLNRLRTEPGVETLMASLALVRWETRRGLGVGRRCRVLPIIHVAGLARCRKSQELPDSGALVTLVALHHGVRAQQRKSVEVLLDRLIRDIPTRHGVALGAIGSHLTAMNVGVAVRAVFADIRKDRFDVALRAGNFFVHAAKGISRGVVVEFRNGANRNPAGAGVAVLARNGKRAVRVPCGLLLRIRRADEGKCEDKEHQPRAYLEHSEHHCAPQKAAIRLEHLRDIGRSNWASPPKSSRPWSLQPRIGLVPPQLSGYSKEIDFQSKKVIRHEVRDASYAKLVAHVKF